MEYYSVSNLDYIFELAWYFKPFRGSYFSVNFEILKVRYKIICIKYIASTNCQ